MARSPYNPKGACRKCGGTDIYTKYCQGQMFKCLRYPFEEGKHMDRHCRTCGYDWAEECLSERVDTVSETRDKHTPNLQEQIDWLAARLIEEFGGPTVSESAVEMAVRVLREQRAELKRMEELMSSEKSAKGLLRGYQDACTDLRNELERARNLARDARKLVMRETVIAGALVQIDQFLEQIAEPTI